MRRICAALLMGVLGTSIALVAGGSAKPSGGFSELHRGDVAGTDDLKILGLNAARLWKFEIPERERAYME